MSYIRCVSDEEATGLLARIYKAARKRAGRVFQILWIQSLEPDILRTSTLLYQSIMHAPGPLSRFEREAVAVIVSKTNGCHY